MAKNDEIKVEVSVPEAVEALKAEPNVAIPYDDPESDIINNEHAGEDADSQAAKQALAPPGTNLESMMAAMLRVAESMEKITTRQEATRQIPYSEILPISPQNPEGRKDRVKFRRPTTLQGIYLNPLSLWEEEIVLFNKLKPGRYIDRKVEVRMTQDGAIDLSWPGAKNDARIEMYSTYPTLTLLLKAVIAEREAKEERLRKGIYTDDDSLTD